MNNSHGVLQNVQQGIVRHGPEILAGIATAGFFAAPILAVPATVKAVELLEEAKRSRKKDKLTPKETAQVAWKCYIPVAVTLVASTACLYASSSLSFKRNVAIGAAYELSKTALKEYREKVIETVGEETEHQIREKVDKARVEKNPVSNNEVIVTGGGEVLCYDALSGRYFKSDVNAINAAVNEINKSLLNDMYISLNEFYDELDLEHTDLGDDLGWRLDDGLISVHFTSQVTSDNRPCIVMNYDVAPRYDYYKLS